MSELRPTTRPAGPVLPPWLPGPGYRIFSSPSGAARFRRATDVLVLLPSLVGLIVLVLAYPPGRFERALASLLASVPSWISPVANLLYDVLGAAAVVGVLAALAARRGVVVGQAAASLVLAVLVALGAARLALGSWPDVGKALTPGPGAPDFPGVRLAAAATVLLAISPHLVQPLQRAGRWLLTLGLIGALVADGVSPGGNLAGILIAVIASAGTRLAFGTSAGRPTVDDVTASLAQLRVTPSRLQIDARELAGIVVFTGADEQGRELVVRVHGRDAYDNQLLEKLWRTLWYQDGGPRLRLTRGQAVEHEAFVTLLARANGVATQEVVRAATTTRGDARARAAGQRPPLGAIAPADVDADLAATLLAGARGCSMTPTSRTATSTPRHVVLVGSEVGFVELGCSTAAPRPRTA